ncbi:MAG: hypothetical protein J7M38_00940, partial [Armatimonadetes bacterium]|nr:hypothetical protein [Armatimonadota bacterium]
MRYALALMCLAACVPASAGCDWDAEARTLSDGVITLQFPDVGEPCNIAVLDGDRGVSPRRWYYCVSGDMQAGRKPFRSSGPVQSITPLEVTAERASVRVEALTDDPDDPTLGRFVMT